MRQREDAGDRPERLLEELWRVQEEISEYLFVEDAPRKADVILIPGNGYAQMAERAAQLWRDGYAPRVLPSGKYSVSLGHFAGVQEGGERYAGTYRTEWEFLCRVLTDNGVPREAILREDEATFTYENAIRSRHAADRAGLVIRRAILCCRNFHARRCLLYYQQQFPDTEFLICPSEIGGIRRSNWYRTAAGIDGVMGELDRLIRQFNLLMKIPGSKGHAFHACMEKHEIVTRKTPKSSHFSKKNEQI